MYQAKFKEVKQTVSTIFYSEMSAEYQKARERARRQPDDLTAIIIDGMDQAKTDVPHFIKRDKASVHLARLPVHITGKTMVKLPCS